VSIRKKLKKTLNAGEQSSLPQYGLKEIISTLAEVAEGVWQARLGDAVSRHRGGCA
jgi:hypothetical protein